MEGETHARVLAFREDLPLREVPDLVRRHITFGGCYALREDQYIDLKQRVAQQYSVHHTDVLVVGSAKLGFSIAPDKRYRPFGDYSDIDVVLCSSELFDRFWQDVFAVWARGENWDQLREFRKYLFRGWMRPDMLPPRKTFQRAADWWGFFRDMTASRAYGPYKLSGALYKSYYFLESYQAHCVRQCKEDEEARP